MTAFWYANITSADLRRSSRRQHVPPPASIEPHFVRAKICLVVPIVFSRSYACLREFCLTSPIGSVIARYQRRRPIAPCLNTSCAVASATSRCHCGPRYASQILILEAGSPTAQLHAYRLLQDAEKSLKWSNLSKTYYLWYLS